MKKIIQLPAIILIVFLLSNCGATQKKTPTTENNVEIKTNSVTNYAETITASELKESLYTYASDAFEGRETGEPGQKKAVEFLKNFYVTRGISSLMSDDDYFQEVPKSYLPKGLEDSENVIAYIKGNEKPEEYIIISAHLDHEGIKDGEIYNGADDDGSGTVAILEIADAFKTAQDKGYGPKRSIIFFHATAEEKGLLGSQYFTDVDPIVPLVNIVTNLNIDMIGRVNPEHENDPEYVYLIGSDRLSTELHNVSEAVNKKYTNLKLDYTYNRVDDPNQFYSRSDHYNFAKHNIPVIFYFTGTHVDYHKPTDTPDKIQYDLLEKRTKLIFYTAWELANRENKVVVDKILE